MSLVTLASPFTLLHLNIIKCNSLQSLLLSFFGNEPFLSFSCFLLFITSFYYSLIIINHYHYHYDHLLLPLLSLPYYLSLFFFLLAYCLSISSLSLESSCILFLSSTRRRPISLIFTLSSRANKGYRETEWGCTGLVG